MVEIVPMNFISYQKFVKIVKDVYIPWAFPMKWGLIGIMYEFKLLNFYGMN